MDDETAILNPHMFCFDRSPIHAAIWYASGASASGAGGASGATRTTVSGSGFVGSPK